MILICVSRFAHEFYAYMQVTAVFFFNPHIYTKYADFNVYLLYICDLFHYQNAHKRPFKFPMFVKTLFAGDIENMKHL